MSNINTQVLAATIAEAVTQAVVAALNPEAPATQAAPLVEAPTYPAPVHSAQKQVLGAKGRWINDGPRRYYAADGTEVNADGSPLGTQAAPTKAPAKKAPKGKATKSTLRFLSKGSLQEFKAQAAREGHDLTGLSTKAVAEYCVSLGYAPAGFVIGKGYEAVAKQALGWL